MHRIIAAVLAAAVAVPAVAEAQATRAEVLERQRAHKASDLRPYEPGRLERLALNAEQGRLRRLISPHNGFFGSYGYSHQPVGAGISFGGGFRHDLFDRQARIELEAGTSFRRYQMLRADFSLPRLADERVELGIEGVYRRHPQEDFYGLGSKSLKVDRVSYLYRAGEVQGRAVFRLTPWMRAGTRVGHLAPVLGSGTDSRFPSIEAQFDDRAAPGLVMQPDFTYAEGFAAVDYRDEPGNARDGGLYAFSWRRYGDRNVGRYSFDAFNVLVQQFVPVFDKKRVFAFQVGLAGTQAGDGQQVPFYMQPTVGGSRTLRSVIDYRFRDTHALWMNAEYRWEVFSALDMALFTDWGTVAPGLSALDLSDLKPAYGIGFRFNTPHAVFFRTDIATGGGEGMRVFLKFSKAF